MARQPCPAPRSRLSVLYVTIPATRVATCEFSIFLNILAAPRLATEPAISDSVLYVAILVTRIATGEFSMFHNILAAPRLATQPAIKLRMIRPAIDAALKPASKPAIRLNTYRVATLSSV